MIINLNFAATALTTGLNVAETMKNSSFLVNCMLLLLVLASVIAVAIIVVKFVQYRLAVIETTKFVDIFWKNKDLKDVATKTATMVKSPVAAVFTAGYAEFKETKESWEDKGIVLVGGKVDELAANVDRAMRRETHVRIQLLESGLPFLATVATAAPFIGLFGTVYGIMNAFQEIGKTGSATLGSIAPHLSDALVTTAFGLIAAIPASVAFNYFNARLQKFENEAMNIAADFLNQIKRSNV
ncbi:MotA/TolQ/ExbB proton channel family protein [bacterium]|nr:MotA/TolQ/ExbB proton channel family protein [bacterium]MBP5591301.1 MotA/TolQ/ExbB proton channel family protein [bacterium]